MTVQIGLLLECFISYESETKPFSRNNTSANKVEGNMFNN